MRLGPLGGIRPGMGVTGAPNLPQGERRLGYSPHTGTNNGLGCCPAVGGPAWTLRTAGPRLDHRWHLSGCRYADRGYGQGSPMAKHINRGRSSELSARSPHRRERRDSGLRGRRAAGKPTLGTARNTRTAPMHPARDDGDDYPQQRLPPRCTRPGADGSERGPENTVALDLEPLPSDRPAPRPDDRLGLHASDRPEP